MLRVVQEVRPDWVVGENVAGILSMEDESGLRREVFAQVEGRKITRYADFDHYESIYTRQAPMLVASIIEDLEKEGYEVQAFVVPAASVGAPHRRDRIWFVAHTVSPGAGDYSGQACGQEWEPSQNRFEGLRQTHGEACTGGIETATSNVAHRSDARTEGLHKWGINAHAPINAAHANGERQSGEKYREAESGGFTKIGEKWNSSHATSKRMEESERNRDKEPSTPLGEGLFGRDHAGSY